MRIILLPFLAIIFLIGFAAYVHGEPKKAKNTKQQIKQPTQTPNPTIEIGVLIPQEEQVQHAYSKTKT